jgi:glycosyltransferase involved in cell wall biosynthesis
MKKILAIAPYPYLPYFSGGQKFIAQFFENLAEETELTVISVETNDPSTVSNYRLLPWLKKSFSRYMDLRLVSRISHEVKTGGQEVLICEHPYMAWLCWLVSKKTGIPWYLHTHNIEYQRFRSMGKWWWPILKYYERWAFRKADLVFYITPEDRAFAVKQWGIPESKSIDLPFGITIPSCPANKAAQKEIIGTKHGIAAGDRLILFNGLLSYKPNLDALMVILDQINPLLMAEPGFRYKIIVCGKGLPESLNGLAAYRDKNMVYAGFVDDIESYFTAADIFLNPVQSGGGIKTKMVEAIAYGATVIATVTGATGINKDVCGDKLLTVPDDDWNAFAKAVTAQGEKLADTPAGYYNYYYWKNVARRLAARL